MKKCESFEKFLNSTSIRYTVLDEARYVGDSIPHSDKEYPLTIFDFDGGVARYGKNKFEATRKGYLWFNDEYLKFRKILLEPIKK